jgi:hypothetical protein
MSFLLMIIPRFGFVKYFTYEDCENCIRGFFHLGYQASFAQVLLAPESQYLLQLTKHQKSHNSRLKDLADESSTNLYCSNLPFDMNEGVSRLVRHFSAATDFIHSNWPPSSKATTSCPPRSFVMRIPVSARVLALLGSSTFPDLNLPY